MKIRLLFCLIATTCIFSWGLAQCPDSVQVYVFPEVICPGEIAILSTDSILCANVGDIICVHNDTHDTIIVSPSDWTRLGLANRPYTPLSVVFYVDETCRHGWAVQCCTTAYKQKSWGVNIPGRPAVHNVNTNEETADFSDQLSSISDFSGNNNTESIINSHTNYANAHPAFAVDNPFYLPAMGQLNVLFSVKGRVSEILFNLGFQSLPNEDGDYWWSSSENNGTNAWAIRNTGTISSEAKTTSSHYYVLPVMNF